MKNKHGQYPLALQGQDFIQAQKIIDKLHEVKRTGWVDRSVKDPETVGEHSDALVDLAEKLFRIPGLSLMLKVHDWAESDDEIGDPRSDELCPIERRWTKERKYRAEYGAMATICLTLKTCGKNIFKFWLEYAEHKTKRADIAHQLDKFQMIMKAIEYQKAGQPVLAQEFIGHNEHHVKHPILRKLLEEAIKSL